MKNCADQLGPIPITEVWITDSQLLSETTCNRNGQFKNVCLSKHSLLPSVTSYLIIHPTSHKFAFPGRTKGRHIKHNFQRAPFQLANPVSTVIVKSELWDNMVNFSLSLASFIAGDAIVDVTVIDEGWMEGRVQRTGKYGMLPSNYVEKAWMESSEQRTDLSQPLSFCYVYFSNVYIIIYVE